VNRLPVLDIRKTEMEKMKVFLIDVDLDRRR